ncbi:MAG TPA: glycosyl hydrolase [Gemmatimonadaceae bacterium]|nr:glycosyl hydrolase [Gemmatimonadaceae bacterium]
MIGIRTRRAIALGALIAALPAAAAAQGGGRPRPVTTANAMVSVPYDSLAFTGLRWREVGPFRGGRSVAATGSTARPNEYYMGTTGGGVFKTEDGGESWFPTTDGFFGGTIGAIAVAPSNPDIVYVGGGEYPIRGNVSYGDGLWKSTDAGKTWHFMGLGDTRQIAKVVVDPSNPDVVYVGAFGHIFGPNAERGVFKTTDGGKTWNKILFRNDSTGVADMIMDPSDPNTLYVTFWQAYRLPWTFSSGGVGSTMYKTTDGGAHWTELKNNPGLPAGMWGNSGLAISDANPKIVWALIEAKQGGLYKSSDGGATWQFVNGDNEIKQRAWYYMKVTADPSDTNVLYINNVSFMKSTDGGKTFRAMRGGGHGDSHHLWIAPNDPKRMIETDDGGARVTADGGRTWTDEDMPTGQFYHVIATNDYPYHICGAQQDQSTLCGANRGTLDMSNWESAGGGESGWIAARTDMPWVVYAGSYGNLLTRKDMRTGLTENVNPWPDNPMGHPAKDIKYRFQWTFPIITSVHDANVVYAGAQKVFKSTDMGKSWTVISPDLTYHDPATLGDAGGPLTKDQTSVEYYATIFVLAESPIKAGELWSGSDDGKIYVTRDGGKSWTDVTPKGLAQNTKISSIDPSAHEDGVAYVAANRIKLDDNHPYLWKTTDFGKHWVAIQGTLPDTEPARVLREDPGKRGLLFAGTERSVYFSPDDGHSWQSLALNLPLVPVRDLTFKNGDLIAATHGRGFYIMDNVSSLEQMSDKVMASEAYLFKPQDQVREVGGRGGFGGFARGGRGGDPTRAVHPTGENPPSGIVVQYWLKAPAKTVTLDFVDAKGTLIHRYSTSPALQPEENQGGRGRFGGGRVQRPSNKTGVNTFTGWDMRYPDAHGFNGMVLWAAGTTGPEAPPGTYTVRLSVDGKQVGTQRFKLLPDPRLPHVTVADWEAQFDLAMKIRDKFSATNDAVKTIRYVLYQLDDREKSMPAAQKSAFDAAATPLRDSLQSVEDSLYQSQSHAGEDPLNYPIRLNNRIGALLGVVQGALGRPTKQSYEVNDVLNGLIDVQMKRMKAAMTGVSRVDAVLKQAGLPAIDVSAKEVPGSEKQGGEEGQF